MPAPCSLKGSCCFLSVNKCQFRGHFVNCTSQKNMFWMLSFRIFFFLQSRCVGKPRMYQPTNVESIFELSM